MSEPPAAAPKRRKTALLFIASSLTLTAADFLVSNLFQYVLLPDNNDVSVAAGRVTGALVGFLLNRRVVFRNDAGGWSLEAYTALKYAALWIFNYYAAKFLIDFLEYGLNTEYWLAWMAAGLALYVPSYLLQRYFVFNKKPGGAPRGSG